MARSVRSMMSSDSVRSTSSLVVPATRRDAPYVALHNTWWHNATQKDPHPLTIIERTGAADPADGASPQRMANVGGTAPLHKAGVGDPQLAADAAGDDDVVMLVPPPVVDSEQKTRMFVPYRRPMTAPNTQRGDTVTLSVSPTHLKKAHRTAAQRPHSSGRLRRTGTGVAGAHSSSSPSLGLPPRARTASGPGSIRSRHSSTDLEYMESGVSLADTVGRVQRRGRAYTLQNQSYVLLLLLLLFVSLCVCVD